MSSISCSAPTHTTRSTSPAVSIGVLTRGVSRSRYSIQVIASETTPTGTLMKKIHGQEKLSVIQPPSTGPTTGATRIVSENIASAMPAFSRG